MTIVLMLTLIRDEEMTYWRTYIIPHRDIRRTKGLWQDDNGRTAG